MAVVQALLLTLLRLQVVPRQLLHTVVAFSGIAGIVRYPFGFATRRVPYLNIQRQPQLSTKHGDRRRHSRALVNAAVVRQHIIPLVWVLSTITDKQHVQKRAIKTLCLSILLRVVWRGPRLFNAEQTAHLQHHRRFK
ncbi:hypothetical protein T08_14986 [Trichinella sp. T8]|nr:hypothetical protein T08_14986 [Trichinella sp. T8]